MNIWCGTWSRETSDLELLREPDPLVQLSGCKGNRCVERCGNNSRHVQRVRSGCWFKNHLSWLRLALQEENTSLSHLRHAKCCQLTWQEVRVAKPEITRNEQCRKRLHVQTLTNGEPVTKTEEYTPSREPMHTFWPNLPSLPGSCDAEVQCAKANMHTPPWLTPLTQTTSRPLTTVTEIMRKHKRKIHVCTTGAVSTVSICQNQQFGTTSNIRVLATTLKRWFSHAGNASVFGLVTK